MILSFRHRFAFVAIPKTGTQAVRRCLRPILAVNDWEQCTLLEQSFFPVPALAEIGHGHIEWREAAPFLLGRLEEMTSFAVVRDPFARFASFARFAFRDEGAMPPDHLDRLKSFLSDPVRREHILLREQYRFVCDDAGTVRTEILRYESLQAEFDALAARLGLKLAPLGMVNVSPGSGFVWDDELRGMVRARYADDFALFGYDPDLVQP
jgi:Sulfotransferase family